MGVPAAARGTETEVQIREILYEMEAQCPLNLIRPITTALVVAVVALSRNLGVSGQVVNPEMPPATLELSGITGTVAPQGLPENVGTEQLKRVGPDPLQLVSTYTFFLTMQCIYHSYHSLWTIMFKMPQYVS